MKATWKPRDDSGRIWVTFNDCQFVATAVTEDLIAEIERLRDLMEIKHQLYNIVCEEAERLRDELTGVTDTAYAEIERLRLERERLLDLIRRYAPSLQVRAAECICRCAELAASRPDPGLQAQAGLHLRGCPAGGGDGMSDSDQPKAAECHGVRHEIRLLQDEIERLKRINGQLQHGVVS